ncbi:hypothetical protein BH708_00565 [Brachybacterium sp. P6-10-X1]|uniref:DUF5129 domain-containing protein n=1 Tax=Brachybacterium sp. P6-10-X1 TaxID=1903186 RepID=UPI000971795D|nr:DUF5129 domain-containing protein [Brachybacterium sp. P6-10-X1]APX31469.1 hypothetical protein BH708_00565 [Brachybacterium sp. P6-10-X1]
MSSSNETFPPPRRRSLRRAGTLLALILALVATLLLAPQPAQAVPPSTVSVTDTTGEVDPELLQARLTEVDFRREVDLKVVVLDVTEYGSDPAQEAPLGDAVAAHARDADPELLSEDGEQIAEGTVILALDPAHELHGAFAGDDVALEASGAEAVEDAMEENAEDGQWADALEAGTQKYAELLDRPWWQHPVLRASVAIVVGALVVLSGAALLGRRIARRRVDEALPRYHEMQQRRTRTEEAARALPPSSPYARAALVAQEDLLRRQDTAEQLHERLPAAEARSWTWGLAGSQRKLARDLASTVRDLEDADDDLLATSDLLRREGIWRTAWERELRPLRDSLSALGRALPEEADRSEQEAAAAADVRELGRDIAGELDTLTADLEAERIDPDSALERLDTLTRELSAAAARLQGARIDRLAADDEEREVLRQCAGEVEERGYRSVRGRRHALERDSSEVGEVFWTLSPLLWYSSWSTRSASALETHRRRAVPSAASEPRAEAQ